MIIDYSGWRFGGIDLKAKGGTGVIPAVIYDESSMINSSYHLYLEGEMRSMGISENVYVSQQVPSKW